MDGGQGDVAPPTLMVRAARCTLMVGAATRGLVGAGGVLPYGLRYAHAAWALPLRFTQTLTKKSHIV